MNYNIEYEREEDGRWIAEAPQLLSDGVSSVSPAHIAP
jgi:hypothetical protein